LIWSNKGSFFLALWLEEKSNQIAMAIQDIEEIELEGIKIPICGLSTLIGTKKGIRPKDKEDLLFLIDKKEYLGK